MISQDVLWKAILEDLCDDFVLYVFAKHAHLIDRARGYEFLDKELHELIPDSETGQRRADKLIRAWLLDGGEQVFYVLGEVQGYRDGDFERRLFTYFYRILDRFGQRVTAVVIFTEPSKRWHPKSFRYSFMGTELTFSFNTLKLASLDKTLLAADSNPFALVLEAAIESLDRRKPDDQRIEIKVALVRKMLARGYPPEKMRALFSFVKFVGGFQKPEALHTFDEQIQPFIKSPRPMGIVEAVQKAYYQEGIKEGLEEGLEISARQLFVKGYNRDSIVNLLSVSPELAERAERSCIRQHFLDGFDRKTILEKLPTTAETVDSVVREMREKKEI